MTNCFAPLAETSSYAQSETLVCLDSQRGHLAPLSDDLVNIAGNNGVNTMDLKRK